MFDNFEAFVDFTRGILDGVNLARTGKMVVCIDNIEGLIGDSDDAYNNIIQNTTVFGALYSIDMALGTLYQAGGLTSDCVQGGFEAKDNLLKYIDFV